ncbi:MAG: hypothetical protein IPM26_16965 [Saprospiraceae bacterium]|nr:hypothetical protein [Saprospiraceae bacterium]
MSGSATTVAQRTQFNAQITLIVPASDSLIIVERFNPLQNNGSYMGTIPLDWVVSSTVFAPEAQPQSNFYSIIPSLSPTSQYNNLQTGDTVKLFSIRHFNKVTGLIPNDCGRSIRFFENGSDPDSSAPGMGGGDFKNGFTIGGIQEKYQGNLPTIYPPKPKVNYNFECSGDINVDVNAQTYSCHNPLTYAWSGPGHTSSNEDLFISPASAGNNGLYTLIVADARGCADTLNIDLQVKPNAGNDLQLCGSGNLNLIATPAAGGNWSGIPTNPPGANLGSTTGGQANVSFLPGSTGEYFFIYDTGICSDTTKVTVSASLNANITGNNTICSGETTTFTASGGVNYIWSNFQTGPTVVVSSPGTYTVTVSDASGCTGTASRTLNVNNSPTAVISGTTDICAGSSTTLTASGGVSYLWDNGSTGATRVVNSAGTVRVTVTDSNGCTGETSANINLNSGPTAVISGTTDICAGSSTTLTASGGVSYVWDNGSTGATRVVNSAGTVRVTVTDNNGCTGETSANINLNSGPTAVISGTTDICAGSSTTLTASGGVSYVWDNGSTGATRVVNSAGTVRVTVTDNNGCTGETSANINLNSGPTAVISGTTDICAGSSTTLTASGGVSYVWDNGSTGATRVVNSAGTVRVTVTDNNGCTGETSANINLNSGPTAVISGTTDICAGSSTTLTASGGVSYVWDNGSTGATRVVNSAGTVRVTVTDNNGCTGETSANINLNSGPTAVISGTTDICAGSSTTLTASGGVSYVWDNGSTGATRVVNSAGTVKVTVTDNNGCTGETSANINLNSGPTAVISGTTDICAGSSTTLTASGGVSYVWDNGSTGATRVVNSAGTVRVTVTDINGCTGETSANINLNSGPTAVISGTTDICAGSSTTLTASGGVSYVWDNGSTGATRVVNSAGTVRVTVTDSNGCTGETSTNINLNSGPTAVISGTTDICAGSSTTLTASGGVSYVWDNGSTGATRVVNSAGTVRVTVTDSNGCTGETSANININSGPTAVISGTTDICAGSSTTLTASGGVSYVWDNSSTGATRIVNSAVTVRVTVTDSNGCTGETSANININSGPTAVISGTTDICAGSSTTLTASGGVSYVWDNGSTGATRVVNSAGTVRVTVTDSNGCTGETSANININSGPTAVISGTTDICAGSSTTLTASGGVSYVWDNGSTGATRVVNSAGTVRVTVTDSNGCTGETSANININSGPTAVISGTTDICAGSSTTLTASGGVSYVWDNGSTGATRVVNSAGTVRVTVTDINGCTGETSANINLNSGPTAVISGTTDICAGSSTTLTASGGVSYVWDNGSTGATRVVNSAGTVRVTVTDSNGCTERLPQTSTSTAARQPSSVERPISVQAAVRP